MDRFLSLAIVAIVAAVIVGAVFTRHGLLDLRKFSNQVETARQRVAGIEDENRKLKLQLNLFSQSSTQITESQIRAYLGWARADEWVYLEKNSK